MFFGRKSCPSSVICFIFIFINTILLVAFDQNIFYRQTEQVILTKQPKGQPQGIQGLNRGRPRLYKRGADNTYHP